MKQESEKQEYLLGCLLCWCWKNNINQHMQKRLSEKRADISNDWLDDGDPQHSSPPTAEFQKHSPKSPRSSQVEKTQRIKKPKKQERKTSSREESQTVVQSVEDRLVCEAVDRLRVCHSKEGGTLPIFKKLTRERLLEFLEMIEHEYSQVVALYLAERRGLDARASLKGIFLRYIDSIVAAFPVLNNIVFQYAFQYYASGPLASRFNRLMDKNITPILKLMSEQYNKQQPNNHLKEDVDASTHVSHSPQREHLEDFEIQDAKKSEKRKRKRNKKKEEQQADEPQEVQLPYKMQKSEGKVKQEVDRSVAQLTNYLQNLCIDHETRVTCRIQEHQITRWRQTRPNKPL